MNYQAFYWEFGSAIFFTIVCISVFFFLLLIDIKKKGAENFIVSLLLYIGTIALTIVIILSWLVPTVKDYLCIKQNKSEVISGIISDKRESSKPSKHYMTIDGVEILVSFEDYYNIKDNENLKISYLPNTKIAIKVEKQ